MCENEQELKSMWKHSKQRGRPADCRICANFKLGPDGVRMCEARNPIQVDDTCLGFWQVADQHTLKSINKDLMHEINMSLVGEKK